MKEIRRSITIARPVADVAAQFADVGHHQRSGVHRGVKFSVITETAQWCDYEQRSRIGPRTVRQQIHLDRRDVTHQINTVVGGLMRRGTLTFDIQPHGSTHARVTATLEPPPTPVATLLGPLLRLALGRSLGRALCEDRDDIEANRPGT